MESDEPLDNLNFIKRDDELDFSKIDKYTTDIDKFTEEFLNYVSKNYNDFKTNQELIKKKLKPYEARDKEWDEYLFDDYLEPKKEENDEEKISVDKAMKHLEDAKRILNEITTIINDTKSLINKRKIGTLQGITRQVIAEHEIEPNENDEVARAVLEQPYNELEYNDIKGGRNKRVIKTKKRKINKKINKKSRKINKYKY